MTIYVVDTRLEFEAATPEEAEDLVTNMLDDCMPQGWYASIERVSELTNG